MKKSLAFLISSLAALGLAHGQAAAWFRDCNCCSSKCCTTICLRQYNAFTPICFGSLNCEGCCPMGFGGFCGQPMVPHGYDPYGGNGFMAAGYANPGYANPGYAYAPAAAYAPRAPWTVPMMPTPIPTMPAPSSKESMVPTPAQPNFRAPLPAPMDQNSMGTGGGPTARAPQAVPYVVPVMFVPSYQPAPAQGTGQPYGLMPYYWKGAPVAR